MSSHSIRLVALALVLALGGCGATGGGTSGVFAHGFPDNHGEHLSSVLARLEAARAPASSVRRESAIVLGVTAAPSRLVAYDLAASAQLWESSVTLRSVPQLAGRYVVTHEGNEIVVRELRTGRVTSRMGDRSLNLVGAAGEGADGAIVLSTGGGVGSFSVLQGLSSGSPSFTAQLEQTFGAPAVSAGMVFVPWGHQNLSAIDLASGTELARLRAEDGVVATATALDGHVFFGQSGVAQLTTETNPAYLTLSQTMPGDPQLLRDAYQPPQGANSAQNRVRLAYRPVSEGGHAAFADGSVYLVFYRLVFALAADGRSARWVAQLPRDAVGAHVVDGGVLIFDETGASHLLSTADGRETWSGNVGTGLIFAVAAAEGLTGGAPRGDAMPLRDQLLSAAQNTDGRLVPLRELAVRLLGAIPEPDVTVNLITLCDDHAITPSVRTAACEALAERRIGNEHVIAALDRHAAFLRGMRAPPVGALARAAVGMSERNALPMLVAHLRDPETAAADIAPLAQALASFGDASAAAPLGDFLRLYHAEASDSGLEPGLLASIEAYRTLLGPTSRELLEEIAGDGIALESVRNAARAQVASLDAPAAAAAGGGATGSEGSGGAGADMTITEADDPRPPELTSAMVQALLDDNRPDLERCLITPARVYMHARVVLVVDPQGQVLMVTSNPPAVLECVEAIARAATYPATRARGRQTVTYEIRR